MKEVSKEEAIECLKKDYPQEEIDIIFAYHKDHKIFKDEFGRLEWEQTIDFENEDIMTLNSVVTKFIQGKVTQEEYMGYSRKIGYTLGGYWEVFWFNGRFNKRTYEIDMAKKRDETIDNILDNGS